MSLTVKVYDNGDHSCLVWEPGGDQPTQGCRGFAVRRKKNGKQDCLTNRVGFTAAKPPPAGSAAPAPQSSEVWPIQRYLWWDYDVQPGDKVQYQVVPILGAAAALKAAEPLASGWTPTMEISGQATAHLSAFFNKGIIASQWVTKALAAASKDGNLKGTLTQAISQPGNPLRDALGGLLKKRILDLLAEVKSAGGILFAALYELNDPELEAALMALGDKVNLILANGAFQPPSNDENQQVREYLKAKSNIKVFDRLVSSGHFAHNKFVVFCDPQGKAQRVLTGSTNWTMSGLCTQANNGLVIDDATVADAYLQEWERLQTAGNGFPPSLIAANSQAKGFDVDGGRLSLWFAPTDQGEDLQQARRLINQANQGILFLFFNPGTFQEDPNRWTLLQSILNRHQPANNPYYQPDLYIHGVVNQQIPSLTEPGPANGAPATKASAGPAGRAPSAPGQATGGSPAIHQLDPAAAIHPVSLFTRGDVAPTRLNQDVLVPANIRAQYTPTWDTELKGASMVMVHSKVVVLDPFGPSPVVMTGSHNLGPKASAMNDDNLVIIEGNAPLAAAYAVNIISIYDQYRWRSYVTNQQVTPQPGQQAFTGLEDDDQWQQGHLSGDSLAEIRFFMGNGPAGGSEPGAPAPKAGRGASPSAKAGSGQAIRSVTSVPAKRTRTAVPPKKKGSCA